MTFQAKIQPMDSRSAARIDPVRPRQSRLRRFFVPRTPVAAAPTKADVDRDSDDSGGGGARADVDNTVLLDRMVLSFMEDGTEMNKPLKSRCNCFNGNYDESSDEEVDLQYGDVTPVAPTTGDALEIIKGLVPCTNVTERNLLADASKFVERTRNSKCGKSESRKIVCDGLKSLGYDAAVCKSKWEKTSSIPAGEHEYIDVISSEGRLVVEIDFRSEFEIARSTKRYRNLLQILPSIYVGTSDRMAKIVALVSEAVKQSMRKKGLHFPPWRKSEYMKSKWLSKHERMGMEVEMDGSDLAGRDIAVNFEVCSLEKITVVVRPSEVVIGMPKKKPVAGLTAVL
ncbi:hypothetical protein LUZ63_000997 [Rhynchospora breviuscula]|uniref:Uncharacterized protein n=1 Tax=Rhynchospora breviuscula TaxID=2022672 RepID=A0A9Q0HXF5_9POAL|nr:hypothetical protein LUZ63_000997 [Rhynchospora breviuscula]